MATYFDKLRAASRARDSLLCVGLDPDPKVIPGGLDGAVTVCRTLIEATSDLACCYKPNAAFWEQYGPRGWEGLATVKRSIPPDIPVLFDCKRADVPNTMAAYASAVFEAMEFDAATVHAYHGGDSLAAFTAYDTRGVYVVCHTSNPGRVDLQHRRADDEPLFMAVAGLAERSGRAGNTGVVIGATAPAEAATVRAAFPQLPFLLPGIGRQGGDLEAAVRAAFTGDPASCLVAVASAIMHAGRSAARCDGVPGPDASGGPGLGTRPPGRNNRRIDSHPLRPVLVLFALLGGIALAVHVWQSANSDFLGLTTPDLDALAVSPSGDEIRAGGGRWRIAFESDAPSAFAGVVRHVSRWRGEAMPFMTHDVLVATGDYADPARVTTRVAGHRYSWVPAGGTPGPTGSLHLLHTVVLDPRLYRRLLALREGDDATITGREILRVDVLDSDGRRIGDWHDEGCNTLLVTGVEAHGR